MAASPLGALPPSLLPPSPRSRPPTAATDVGAAGTLVASLEHWVKNEKLALLRLARERTTVHAPQRLARPFEKAGVPSIPVCDQAWGYDENAYGALQLQQPPLLPPNSGRGPAAYSPMDISRRSVPTFHFGSPPSEAPKARQPVGEGASEWAEEQPPADEPAALA